MSRRLVGAETSVVARGGRRWTVWFETTVADRGGRRWTVWFETTVADRAATWAGVSLLMLVE